MAAEKGGRTVARYGWAPLVALAMTVGLDSGEKISLSHAAAGIEHAFHVTDAQVGFLPFAMGVVAIGGAIPFGLLADRLRRTRLMGLAMAIWTGCIALNGLATSYIMLFAFRMGLGAVEANSPAAVSMLGDYYPTGDRGKTLGLYQLGALVGSIVALVVGGIAVQLGGWRWAFLFWVPIGVGVAMFVSRQPHPERGAHDAHFEVGPQLENGEPPPDLLPEPRRAATIDYKDCSLADVGRELLHIPSFWLGNLSVTVGQLLLIALQFWSIPYFERVHHLKPAAAGGITGLLGIGAVAGILGGGFLSDRLLRQGIVNAKVWVIVGGSLAATAILVPAFLSTSLVLSAPLLFLGGIALTLPTAPSDALVLDVVVPELRGRALAVRSVVRTLSQLGAFFVGLISTTLISGGLSRADGLRYAIVSLIPIYAIGGLVMLLALRTYPSDVSFVVRHAREQAAEEVLA